MTLKHLHLSCFRNFHDYSIDFSPQINVLHGVNGVGKTSILEAVYLLATGRSFRTTNLNLLMNSSSKATTIYAEIEAYNKFSAQVGYYRERGQDRLLKLNQHNVASISEVAAIFPACCLEINIFMALLQPPQFRRKILDWGLFHVKHEFFARWKEYNQILKQRNSILKHAKEQRTYVNSRLRSEIQSWDRLFAKSSVELAQLRQSYLEEIKPYFQFYTNILINSIHNLDVSLSVKHGLPVIDENEIYSILEANLSNDLYKGYTSIGPHKADLDFSVLGISAKNILSRGQQKVLIIAYYLSQLALLKEKYAKRCTVLIDDMAAELDFTAQNLIYEQFYKLGHQLIISSVDKTNIPTDIQGIQFVSVSRETNKTYKKAIEMV
jgi:DNA replication and repair protein RecF